MKEYIKELTASLGFPGEATTSLLEAYDAVYADKESAAKFDYWIDRYNKNYFRKDWTEYDRMLDDVKELSEKIKIDHRRTDLLIFILLAPHLKELYEENGYTEKMYHDTMMDLYAKMTEEYEVSKIWGTSVASWFSGFYNLDRFGFGRLQFELIEFGWDSFDDGKGHTLTSTSNIVNVHIPALGKLDHDACLEAYKLAADFYSDRFDTDYVPFLCSSWLLDKPVNERLPETSNIRIFMNDFNVFRWGEEKPSFWNYFPVFKTRYVEDYAKLPTDTSVMRTYREWAMMGGTVGDGSGVLFVDKPNLNNVKWKGKKKMYSFYKDYDPEADKRGDYV